MLDQPDVETPHLVRDVLAQAPERDGVGLGQRRRIQPLGLSSDRLELAPPSRLAGLAGVGHSVVVAGNPVRARGERMGEEPALVEGVGQIANAGHGLVLEGDRLAVRRQTASGAQVADQIPVQGGLVAPAGLWI